MKFITPKYHGIIDYLRVIILLVSPAIFGFTGSLAIFTYALGAAHLLLSILTDYPLGIFKIIPVTIHATIEVFAGIILIILAYTWFHNNPVGKLFYVIYGTVILLTWLVTDYMGNEFNEATL
jgi:hypothetical protein